MLKTSDIFIIIERREEWEKVYCSGIRLSKR